MIEFEEIMEKTENDNKLTYCHKPATIEKESIPPTRNSV